MSWLVIKGINWHIGAIVVYKSLVLVRNVDLSSFDGILKNQKFVPFPITEHSIQLLLVLIYTATVSADDRRI